MGFLLSLQADTNSKSTHRVHES